NGDCAANAFRRTGDKNARSSAQAWPLNSGCGFPSEVGYGPASVCDVVGRMCDGEKGGFELRRRKVNTAVQEEVKETPELRGVRLFRFFVVPDGLVREEDSRHGADALDWEAVWHIGDQF